MEQVGRLCIGRCCPNGSITTAMAWKGHVRSTQKALALATIRKERAGEGSVAACAASDSSIGQPDHVDAADHSREFDEAAYRCVGMSIAIAALSERSAHAGRAEFVN